MEPIPAQPTQHDGDIAGVIRAHQAWVWRYLRFLGCDAALADDLTQDTFVALLRQQVRPAALRPYLRRVAYSVFAKAQRRSATGIAPVDVELADAAFDRFCRDDGGTAYLEALRRCLAGLAERPRRALDLRYRDGCSRREIARRLGIAEEGAKSLLARTLARLRLCVERRLAR